jgi:dolichol-phosphate mannosyltransferase
MSLAIDGVLSTSVLPLRAATLFGLLVSTTAILLSIGYTVAKLFFGSQWPAGFTTLTILILLSTGINSLFLGIIGEYLARIYRQAKYSDEVLVEASVGIE